MRLKQLLILLVIICTNTLVFSQNKNGLGSWNILNITMKASPKWSLFTEGQIRSLSFYDEFHYYELKFGLTYKIKPNFSVTTGIGDYNTYSEGGNFESPIQNNEIRTWFQVNLKNPFDYIVFEHRYRAEQRFTSNDYRNRFRYRLSAVIPLQGKKIESKTFYLTAWNEIFFTDKEPFFERNRVFMGGGYEFSENLALQTGYIYQYDYKINDETGRDFFNIALLYNFDLKQRGKHDFHPSTND
ncbi:DUF2490 domain-containing protein [Flavobacterium paronense]|uniref:DUF2490 domain-containing protein n=1 Tax=Flavobacterium paronense TaxID=1392775 RepID=A0ABV5GCZ1_9FLAO|nr:DUF2490 domain-containing protein [Flavobacterium paronense]MDN3676187.1 DUF2490 domain-containing protein [Flavobacterium paronense]